jgi:hypothetical protein
VLLALLCPGCGAAPSPGGVVDVPAQPTGVVTAAGATVAASGSSTSTPVSSAGSSSGVKPDETPPPHQPEPGEAAVVRKVAVEAPRQMIQGRPADLYLSFGAPDRQPNLPGAAGGQQSSGPASLPAKGLVRPGLDVTGGARAEPVEVGPISVENSIPKRWHWRILVPEDEEVGPSVTAKPYLLYSETPDGPGRVIWPDQDVTVTIQVAPPPTQRRLLRFLGDTSSALQLFGASLVMLMTWLYGFGRWLWPRLRSAPQPAPAPTEEAQS